jgi:hypothetical protein
MVAESGAAMMQDVIGIVLLLGTAFLLRFSIHSTAMVHVTVRVIPFNVIAFGCYFHVPLHGSLLLA